MHLHVSALDATVVFAYVIIFAFFWRVAQAQLSDTPVGKAMAFIF